MNPGRHKDFNKLIGDFQKFLIQPRTMPELCQQFSADPSTIYRWFRKLEAKPTRGYWVASLPE